MFKKKKGKDKNAEGGEPPPSSPPASAPPPNSDLGRALTAFYEKHAPAKVKNVSNLLTHIENGDLSVQELNQLLLDEYGEGFVSSGDPPPAAQEAPPEEEEEVAPPPAPAPAPPAQSSAAPDNAQLLTAFYQSHAPEKLEEPGKVAHVLEGFGDNIEDLNAALKNQYGQDLNDFKPQAAAAAAAPPPRSADAESDDDDDDDDEVSKFRAKLYVFYNQYAPDKVGNVETLAQQFAGEEDKLNASLMEVYGADLSSVPESALKSGPLKARLTAFYRIHAPDNTSNVDALVERFDGKEEQLNEALLEAYG